MCGFSRLFASFPATFSPIRGTLAVCKRTHACAPIRLRRAIHRLDRANSVCSCAVFFFKARYPRQRILVVAHDSYAYLVPFVEEESHFFLKTIIPSRKASRDYLNPGDADAEH